MADEVLRAAPTAPPALHLRALCARRLGDAAAAQEAFERALVGAPRDLEILTNYGNFLRAAGQPEAALGVFRRALAVDGRRAETFINLALAQGDLRRHQEAEAAALEATRLAPRAVRAWRTLGSVRKESGDLRGAEAALRDGLEVAPADAAVWLALGVVLRLQGKPAEALDHFAKARSLAPPSAELMDAEAGALLDLGELDAAIEKAEALTAFAPAYTPGHQMLAEMLWQKGDPGQDPLAPMRAAVAAQPQNRGLRASFASAALRAGLAEEALGHLRALRGEADDPVLMLTEADALRTLGDAVAAEQVLREALPRMADAPHVRTAFARHLLRLKRPDEAAEQGLLATALDPADQEAWAILSVAWRLLEDPREDWLCGYDRYVMSSEVAPPPGYRDTGAFLERLIETLTALHVAKREPSDQSLRHGSQTSGSLFGRADPVIAEAAAAIGRTRDAMIQHLPQDPTHPYLRRNTGRARYVGSWSVRLWSSGRHISHFHPEGWVSSAFYVQLPASVRQAGTAEGRIEFGVPPDDLGLDLPARRTVDPQPGHLVLFPSYMWHGTTAFEDPGTPRMTIAFDAVPEV